MVSHILCNSRTAQFAAETKDAVTGNSIGKPTNNRPDDLAGNASSAVRAAHTDELNQYEKIEDVSSELHIFILALMSPAGNEWRIKKANRVQ